MGIQRWKYTIIKRDHEHTPHGGGASEGCRPKLPRWPFSSSSCTQASGTALHESMVGSQARRVKVFVSVPHCCRFFFSCSPPDVQMTRNEMSLSAGMFTGFSRLRCPVTSHRFADLGHDGVPAWLPTGMRVE